MAAFRYASAIRQLMLAAFGWLVMLSVAHAETVTAAARPAADPYLPLPYVQIKHPQWARNAVIYQINLRQFTPEGTLQAASRQLPRLHDMGIGIVWLMPIHPIGEKNRKGTLGSPYSVRDYRAVSPEFGSLADLRSFVAQAHALGMRVILDWVANHSSWDNPLVTQHPQWYGRDWQGRFHPTSWNDWADIIEFDYDQPGLRRYMTESLLYWVREADIDGYRCDVAGFVPLDFWENARRELDAVKPVFMLAEWEATDLHARAFDMTYAWGWYNAMHEAARSGSAGALRGYYSTQDNSWPRDAMRMTFVSNHDKNAWDGTEFEVFGDALPLAMVLSVVGDGMPLIYNGQEAGNPRRLPFFEKDPIVWRDHPNGQLYRQLIRLKKTNSPLWNGAAGARMIDVPNTSPNAVLSFVRQDDSGKVFAVFNLSSKPVTVGFRETLFTGRYSDYFSDAAITLESGTRLELAARGFRVLVR